MNSHQRYMMKQRIDRIHVEVTECGEQLWKSCLHQQAVDPKEETVASSKGKFGMLWFKLNECIDGINEIRQILRESDPRPAVDELEGQEAKDV